MESLSEEEEDRLRRVTLSRARVDVPGHISRDKRVKVEMTTA